MANKKTEKPTEVKEEKKVVEKVTTPKTEKPMTVKMQKGDKILNVYNSPECIKQAESEGCILIK